MGETHQTVVIVHTISGLANVTVFGSSQVAMSYAELQSHKETVYRVTVSGYHGDAEVWGDGSKASTY